MQKLRWTILLQFYSKNFDFWVVPKPTIHKVRFLILNGEILVKAWKFCLFLPPKRKIFFSGKLNNFHPKIQIFLCQYAMAITDCQHLVKIADLCKILQRKKPAPLMEETSVGAHSSTIVFAHLKKHWYPCKKASAEKARPSLSWKRLQK